MPRYFALLRGINVGGNKKVPMARLRALLEGLGYRDVATLLQSGNAVLTAKERRPAKVAADIESAIAEALGFAVDVIVRTRDELAAVLASPPLAGAEADPAHFLVVFFADAPDARRLAEIDREAHLPDEFVVTGREIYARFPSGIGRSKLAAHLTGAKLGVATARNWSTLQKLLAME